MKLMGIHDTADSNAGTDRLADVLIPKIGRFSNTQNKVSMSDLSANDKPHPDLHRISISTPARDPSGGTMNTYWFYENSRGKWDELRRHENTQAKENLRLKIPKQQRFDKGMFAKVWYSHLGKPTSLKTVRSVLHFSKRIILANWEMMKIWKFSLRKPSL